MFWRLNINSVLKKIKGKKMDMTDYNTNADKAEVNGIKVDKAEVNDIKADKTEVNDSKADNVSCDMAKTEEVKKAVIIRNEVEDVHKRLKAVEEKYRKHADKLPFFQTGSCHGLSLMNVL